MNSCPQRDPGPHRGTTPRCRHIYALPFLLLPALLFADPILAQDVGSLDKEYEGNGSVITVRVHEPSGALCTAPAVVSLFRGITPSGQHDTSRGVAEFVVTRLDDYTVAVTAPGYAEVRKDFTVVAGRTQVDVYLRGPAAQNPTAVPGRPVLAPKAREALDKCLRALKQNNLGDADKYVREAVHLAPGNPDVLYIEGVVNLKQQNWKQAQSALEKATEMDPSSSRSFAALGMALCDQGSYDAAIAALSKSLQLEPAGSWETLWALAKSYYHVQRYDDALKASQDALAGSNGKAPEIALLVAQSLTAVGRYEEAARLLRQFQQDHPDRPEVATARRWLEQLSASGKVSAN